ncbi:hypothetical protein EHI8A_181080 [Entamoeba histolytica HM-1:IMSS-B]|uniref:Uncharacterized protein n=3 Tax=Entamoeba histolytica TaxID=5759 RepID=M3TIP6_ENTH1|nr:Hypothetical protein EHI5A_213000 [Entamoeba histolytica KU27]EMH75253.1 hypothetical protein EHI8A_181080 [Entamoeba histolytica HM-1:IMSS-B]ENY66060.1 unknown protein, putative [Entamoeba histolytica HM-1:IMSS-A]
MEKQTKQEIEKSIEESGYEELIQLIEGYSRKTETIIKIMKEYMITEKRYKKPEEGDGFKVWETHYDQMDEMFRKKQNIYSEINKIEKEGERMMERMREIGEEEEKKMRELTSYMNQVINNMIGKREAEYERNMEGKSEKEQEVMMKKLEKEIKEMEELKTVEPVKFVGEKKKKGTKKIRYEIPKPKNMKK